MHMDADKQVVYICSRYRGDRENNIRAARRYCRMAVERGCVPIAPHLLLPQFMEEETEREAAMEADLVLLSRCDEIWVCGSEISEGMAAEIQFAKEKQMKIRRIIDVRN